MFERFTDRARRISVLAQEIAREQQQDAIRADHLLLGCLREGHGVAAIALKDLEVEYAQVEERVLAKHPIGDKEPEGHMPFAPTAKRALELALREALQLGHNYIGTEHVLLALCREGFIEDALGGVDTGVVRKQVIKRLTGEAEEQRPAPFPVTPVDWTVADLVVCTRENPDGIRVAGDLEKCWEHVEDFLFPGRRDRIKWEAAKELMSGRR